MVGSRLTTFVAGALACAAAAGCHGSFVRNPCANVDCSGHGTCLDNGDLATCLCEPGFTSAAGTLECVPAGADGDADSDSDADSDADAVADADADGCVPATELCNELDDDCDGAIDEGFDLATSEEHCGRCGNACTGDPPNAAPACIGGECALACDEGFADCSDAADGCESSLSSPATCGACGTACPDTHPLCVTDAEGGHVCGISCPPGEAACDGECADFMTDAAHCGDCTTPCPSAPHASAACLAGSCDFECDDGWGDCLGSEAGCETDLATTTDCGGCGVGCNAVESCLPDSSGVLGCAIDCLFGCTCEEACDLGRACECRGGCPCHYTCGDSCWARCLDAGTRCVIDVGAAVVDMDRFECQHGAECHVAVEAGGDLGGDSRCRDTGTTCEVDCGSSARCVVECNYGATCLIRCAADATCEFRNCPVEPVTCPDGSLVCNRACP